MIISRILKLPAPEKKSQKQEVVSYYYDKE